MVLHPRTVLHKIPHALPAEVAVMFNPLGAGVRWAVSTAPLRSGDTFVILGAGQRGLTSVIAAGAAGAGMIIATDLARASHKLDLALEFGANHVIAADRENAVERVAQFTDGQLADVVLDVNGATQPLVDAVDMVRPGGTIVLAGVKGSGVATSLLTDKLVFRSIALRGVFPVDSESYRQAIRLIESGAAPLAKMRSEIFPLEEAAAALRRLAGSDGLPSAVHVVIEPGIGAGRRQG